MRCGGAIDENDVPGIWLILDLSDSIDVAIHSDLFELLLRGSNPLAFSVRKLSSSL
jgi:hypothetical protein